MSLDGNNILVKILRLLDEGGELKFVDDQIGCPTFTDDLVNVVMKLVESDVTGVVHVTNGGSTSWFDFAQLVAECAGSDLETGISNKRLRIKSACKKTKEFDI